MANIAINWRIDIMIRKNDSSADKWRKTITPKINWRIGRNSLYHYNKENRVDKMIKQNRGNWPRIIGIHYSDGTNKYHKELISEYKVLKEINRISKKQLNITGTIWPDKIVMNSYKHFKSILKLAENIANKYGFKLIRDKYEDSFPWIRIERVNNYYIYPFL